MSSGGMSGRFCKDTVGVYIRIPKKLKRYANRNDYAVAVEISFRSNTQVLTLPDLKS